LQRGTAVDYSGGLEEIPEPYRPSEWLSEVTAKRSPYLPQIGDDLVYYRQGHEAYIKEVEAKSMYTIPNKLKKQLPYVLNPKLEVYKMKQMNYRTYALK
jgi:bromodomain and WD repeat domain-containing protein 1/3